MDEVEDTEVEEVLETEAAVDLELVVATEEREGITLFVVVVA